MTRLHIADIEHVRGRVARFADVTPLRHTAPLSDQIGADVALKLESLQPTGSFKVRGAAAKLAGLSPADLARGVITASTGNHGRAVAHVARLLGATATICLSEHVPASKVDSLRRAGCELDIAGDSQDAAFARAAAIAGQDGGPVLVHSVLDPVVVAGQGTCGLEIAEQCSAARLVVVPVSGGGLLAGVATAVKARLPAAQVVGVSMEGGAVMHASLAAGHPVRLPEVPTLADSLQGGLGCDNDVTFPVVRQLVDEIVLVTEDEIAAGMRYALGEHRLVLEGAGAVGIAALLAGKIARPDSGSVVVVCSGANAEPEVIAEMARRL